MNEAAVSQQLVDLVQAITSSPFTGQATIGPMPGVYQSDASSQGTSVDSTLDHLRLQVKYLLFDLEATRRENRYLRQMLESRNRRDCDDLKGDGPDTP